MRKLVGFLLTLALAVVPFGGAFAHVKGEDGRKHGHFIKGSVTVDGSAITASGKVASTQTVVKGLEGKWRFSLVNQENKTVDSKVTPVSGKGNSAQATFKDVAPGVYKVVITYNGKIRDKGQEKARDHEPLRFVKRNLVVEKPAEEPQQPGDNGGKGDDQQPGDNDGKGDDQQPGNNDGKNNDQQPGDNKNGAQQPGGNKGTSGTITNPGSGSQQGGQLPKTATSLPLNAMIGGLLTLAGAGILFARRLVG